MNWTRILVGGVVGGIALNIADFVMHGLIMGPAYLKYPVFTREPANPLYFTLVALCIGLATALLFAKSRNSWGEGLTGGLTFGLFLGLVAFFPHFYNSIVIEGFPYHMSWCHGGISLIGFVVLGGVLGMIVPRR